MWTWFHCKATKTQVKESNGDGVNIGPSFEMYLPKKKKVLRCKFNAKSDPFGFG